ncbi:MAG TPA: complex I subunit 5 family protein [Acidimicrobiales bacterium]|nr:complex I subunit 5 family protein [Acidimicrobiales bacterium]
MDSLLPLTVAVPLAVATAISALNPILKGRRRILDAVSITTAIAVTVMLFDVVVRAGAEQVYWFSGIRPHHGVALGIDFAVGRVNGGLACMTSLLVVAALVFSWRYFESISTWFHALVLVFLAGMVGFCLTGDIFDLFVWFEVMGVAAYGLTAYRVEERGPLQGALNFAITNSVGAYLSLSGIALVYARTGALDMAQIGTALSRRPVSGLVVVAFLLVIVGLLTKSAIVPFHLWLADAHAVAPTPVCVLFSGVMVELGLYGIARVYWSMFAGVLGHRATITAVFLALGTLTALVGALYCYRQRHIKRLLAFSTMSHVGLFLIGFSLLTPLGLAGACVYVVGHGLVKAALFLCAGVVLHRLHSVDESALHGRGRELRVTGVVFLVAALGLADLPPFGTFLGAGWVADSATARGDGWVTAVVMVASIVVGGAVLRVAGGVFYGLGDPPRQDTRLERGAGEEKGETQGARWRVPWTMVAPAIVLVVLAGALGVLPDLGPIVQRAAMQFENQASYASSVLHAARGASLATPGPPGSTGVSALSLGSALGTVAGSVLLAWFSLYRRRLPRWVPRPARVSKVDGLLDGFQSGVVNDYVTWLVVGLACVGGVLAMTVR